MNIDKYMIYEPDQLKTRFRDLPEDTMIFNSQGAALDYKHHLQSLHPEKVYIVMTNPRMKTTPGKK